LTGVEHSTISKVLNGQAWPDLATIARLELTAKSPDGASAFSYPLIFLPFISSAFVPTASMPGPVR
jgi:hypothetical protein